LTEVERLKNKTSNLLKPDPDGDVVLECHDQDNHTTTAYRVLSKVLRLASPVFVGMFRPYFQEGHELLQGESPVIELKEDNAPLMSLILNVLHFRGSGENHVMNAERLARLAIHCDKYDLTNALGPWVSFWSNNVERMSQSSEDSGFMLLAAYLFNAIPGHSTKYQGRLQKD
jgi:hypothetical protein